MERWLEEGRVLEYEPSSESGRSLCLLSQWLTLGVPVGLLLSYLADRYDPWFTSDWRPMSQVFFVWMLLGAPFMGLSAGILGLGRAGVPRRSGLFGACACFAELLVVVAICAYGLQK
jgi:hypothetical protein